MGPGNFYSSIHVKTILNPDDIDLSILVPDACLCSVFREKAFLEAFCSTGWPWLRMTPNNTECGKGYLEDLKQSKTESEGCWIWAGSGSKQQGVRRAGAEVRSWCLPTWLQVCGTLCQLKVWAPQPDFSQALLGTEWDWRTCMQVQCFAGPPEDSWARDRVNWGERRKENKL